jgi:hypothetical protein
MQHRQTRGDKSRSEDVSGLGPKGPIALLQEFVQGSKEFALPPNYSALQWTYDSRMASKAALEYRATVAFFLEGVPHHAAGTWHASKKDAQRDTADRALRLFVGKWGKDVLPMNPHADVCLDDGREAEGNTEGDEESDDVEQLLESFCKKSSACDGPPRWSIEYGHVRSECQQRGTCFAIVELQLVGVPHKLAGALQDTESEARADAARRALWYLQCPGFEAAFEPERFVCGKASKQNIATPPSDWLHDESSRDAIADANRKTIVMKTQNRLQQAFSRQLQAGVGVWDWTYETDPNDPEWPPLFRATVHVALVDRSFVGDWARGQREAQIEAIGRVNAFLDDSGIDRPN